MAYRILSYTVLGFIGTSLAKLLRLNVEVKQSVPDLYEPVLAAKFNVDGQVVYGIVDTGAAPFFFVWKHFYESNVPNGCDSLVFKCYECDPAPCKVGPTSSIPFQDGTVARIFKHSGAVDFGAAGKISLDFGLTADYSGGIPHGSLGLGPPVPSSPYTPIIQQLLSNPQKPITSSVFSVYIKPSDQPQGELILGGQDSSLYQGSISVAKLFVRQHVKLTGLQVGTAPDIPLVDLALIDSGASHLFIYESIFPDVINYIRTKGTKGVKITEHEDVYSVACTDRPFLPALKFSMKGADGKDVYLSIPAQGYAWKNPEGGRNFCQLLIAPDRSGVWYLGFPAMVGNYFLFDWDNKQIGFAKLK